jgi:acyl-CoA synthetase (AMP-forming)/AMP-acid ligase II
VLINLLRKGARAVPHQPVVVSPRGSTTYAGCLETSESLARGLHSRSIRRFGSLVGDVADLLALLCASSMTGSEACVYPDSSDDVALDRLAGTFEHTLIVTDREPPPDTGPQVLTPGDLVEERGELPPRPERAPVLILTTGTTGHPKGVRHDWGRLAAPRRAAEGSAGERWLLAYNLHQFAGVQIVLHVLATHATLVVPASKRPHDAIAAIRDHGVTHASATPTFWRLVVGLLDPDAAAELPLKQITLGGEAVPDALLDELRRLFPRARLSQIYGATEFGTGVSVRDGKAGLPLSVLSRGDEGDVQFAVRDGQLYARSRVGMLGYWGEGEADEGWRPTGDLVEITGDRIHFVGRVSETINVGGVKVHPLPVEEVVGGVAGVRLARAYGRANPVTGQIVALDVVPEPGASDELVEESIREACETLPPAWRPRLIRFVPDLEVTGHKLARQT